jgi:hypothetical protein
LCAWGPPKAVPVHPPNNSQIMQLQKNLHNQTRDASFNQLTDSGGILMSRMFRSVLACDDGVQRVKRAEGYHVPGVCVCVFVCVRCSSDQSLCLWHHIRVVRTPSCAAREREMQRTDFLCCPHSTHSSHPHTFPSTTRCTSLPASAPFVGSSTLSLTLTLHRTFLHCALQTSAASQGAR